MRTLEKPSNRTRHLGRHRTVLHSQAESSCVTAQSRHQHNKATEARITNKTCIERGTCFPTAKPASANERRAKTQKSSPQNSHPSHPNYPSTVQTALECHRHPVDFRIASCGIDRPSLVDLLKLDLEDELRVGRDQATADIPGSPSARTHTLKTRVQGKRRARKEGGKGRKGREKLTGCHTQSRS